jgi:hypothetical protein
MLGFDINSIDFSEEAIGGNDGFAPIPAGRYVGRLEKWELKDTKDGSGNYLSLRWDVTEGDRAGRVLWQNMTMCNKSDQASKIGRRELAAMLKAFGGDPENGKIKEQLDHFTGSEVVLIVGVRENKQFGPENHIKGFASLESKPSVVTKVAQPAQPATKKKQPWD